MKDKIPKYGTIEWGIYQYEQQKKSMRGHNYRYFNEKWWKEMEDKGWKMLKMKDSWNDTVKLQEVS